LKTLKILANVWTRRRTLEDNNRRDEGHITRGRYCKIYKIPQSEMVWSCGKNAKPTNAKKIAVARMEGAKKRGCNMEEPE
jgi:hypothetical protein